MELKPVKLTELDDTDADLLEKASREELGGVSPVALAEMAQRGVAIIWRFTGDAGERGIFVTTFTQGRELFFWMLAGEGMVKHLKWIYGEFEAIAKQMGAKWMTGIAKPGLAYLYERRLGFEKRNIQVVKEVR